jgi:2-polyprenyl-6-methoxyphenol hydroxylase-like FAD-dependent oxidoreductase
MRGVDPRGALPAAPIANDVQGSIIHVDSREGFLKIAIIGGGIGGLAAALALDRKGFDVTVFEQVQRLRVLGVGINLLPHAVGVLTALGLRERLAATGIDAKEIAFMNRFGQEILVDARGLAAGYEHPQYSIHRGELQMLLYEALCARVGAERVRTGHRLATFEHRGRQVRASFVDKDSGAPVGEFDADVLIAADGIHSVVRSQFYPNEGPPKWNGVQMWRGVTEGKPFLSGRSQIWSGTNRQKFVCYPISRPHLDGGRALINWICDLKLDAKELPGREDWNRPGHLADFLPRYEAWHFPCLDVPDVIRNAYAVYEFPMVDRDPLDRWTFGRVTLLGDAAHPMYPIGSNGASQAILDAAALADSLAAIPDVEAALADYEDKRRPMAASIVRMNRQQGLDVILDIVDERAPHGFERIDDVIPRAELAAIVSKYKQAAGHQQSAAAATKAV